jgi:hypothetical protein
VTSGTRSGMCAPRRNWPFVDDLDLLRTYEPVLRFTYGELFFPCSAEAYIRYCSLWALPVRGEPELITPPGELTRERLALIGDAPPGQTYFLRFVERPLRGRAFSRWYLRKERPVFDARGRLARVGLGVRLLDSLFEIALLLRGTVPGGTVAAAEIQYRRIARRHAGPPYYGRVTRQGRYIVLQYFFFYAMNDWRTTFHGVNDHEADWEQILVFLDGSSGTPAPAWVAYAAHDFTGDDLRRRWDDPELERVGDHPVVYVGAGSHAAYYKAGEYLARYEIGFLAPVYATIDRVRRIWTDTLRQGDPHQIADRIAGLLRFPFIDYARGDGAAIGPGQEQEWSPVLLDEEAEWAEDYRGLWGLSTRDPFEGESAPGGPKFTRSGTVRQTWMNPLGWAGLHKAPPPGAAVEIIERRIAVLEGELEETSRRIHDLGILLPRLGLEVAALRRSSPLDQLWQERHDELREREMEMNQLHRERQNIIEMIGALAQHREVLVGGDLGDPQAHLIHRHDPQSPRDIRRGRLVELWAALSVGLMLLSFAIVVAIHPQRWVETVLIMSGVFFLIEAALRRHLTDLILKVAVVLAIVSLGVLIFEFFWWILLSIIVGLSLLIIVDNFREVRGR